MAQNHKSQCLSERRRPERGAKWPYKNWPPCERWPPARFTTQHSGIAGLSSLSTGLVWLTTGQQAGCLCACVCQSVRMCVCVFSKCVTRKIKGFLSVTHIKKVSSGLRTPKLHIVQAYRGTHTHAHSQWAMVPMVTVFRWVGFSGRRPEQWTLQSLSWTFSLI